MASLSRKIMKWAELIPRNTSSANIMLGSRLFTAGWCEICRYTSHCSSPSMIGSGSMFRIISGRQPTLLLNRCVSRSYTSDVMVPFARRQEVLQDVNNEVKVDTSRVFAVVHVAAKQFKVTAEDLIQFNAHIAADVGERIVLQKVLLVGGDNFTVIGKPLVSPELVRVEATVIEKTLSEKKILFRFKRRKNYKKYKEMWAPQTVLRINSIEMSPALS